MVSLAKRPVVSLKKNNPVFAIHTPEGEYMKETSKALNYGLRNNDLEWFDIINRVPERIRVY